MRFTHAIDGTPFKLLFHKSLLVRRAACDFDSDRYQLIYLRSGLSGAAELYKLVLRGMNVEPPHSLLKAKSRYFASPPA